MTDRLARETISHSENSLLRVADCEVVARICVFPQHFKADGKFDDSFILPEEIQWSRYPDPPQTDKGEKGGVSVFRIGLTKVASFNTLIDNQERIKRKYDPQDGIEGRVTVVAVSDVRTMTMMDKKSPFYGQKCLMVVDTAGKTFKRGHADIVASTIKFDEDDLDVIRTRLTLMFSRPPMSRDEFYQAFEPMIGSQLNDNYTLKSETPTPIK